MKWNFSTTMNSKKSEKKSEKEDKPPEEEKEEKVDVSPEEPTKVDKTSEKLAEISAEKGIETATKVGGIEGLTEEDVENRIAEEVVRIEVEEPDKAGQLFYHHSKEDALDKATSQMMSREIPDVDMDSEDNKPDRKKSKSEMDDEEEILDILSKGLEVPVSLVKVRLGSKRFKEFVEEYNLETTKFKVYATDESNLTVRKVEKEDEQSVDLVAGLGNLGEENKDKGSETEVFEANFGGD